MTNSQVFQTQPGLFNTNSYLSSGIPFQTGSTIFSSSFGTDFGQSQVDFPYVAKSVTVINTSAVDLRVHFVSALSGSVVAGHHYTTLTDNKDSMTFTSKCRRIYISLATGSANGSYELYADLTNIPPYEMFPLTGSGLTV